MNNDELFGSDSTASFTRRASVCVALVRSWLELGKTNDMSEVFDDLNFGPIQMMISKEVGALIVEHKHYDEIMIYDLFSNPLTKPMLDFTGAAKSKAIEVHHGADGMPVYKIARDVIKDMNYDDPAIIMYHELLRCVGDVLLKSHWYAVNRNRINKIRAKHKMLSSVIKT